MIKKRGLGRSLDILLGGVRAHTEATAIHEPSEASPFPQDDLQRLPIEYLIRGRYQPRKEIDTESLMELAESIKAQGIIQPIIVRPVAEKKYEIIAGERRWRAAQLAGLTEIAALIRTIPDEAAVAMALIENIQRENLNPLEEANALKRLMDEFQMTQEQVASAVGKSRVTITHFLRLLNLNADVKILLERDDLTMGHAKVLLSLEGNLQSEAAKLIVAKELSVREAESLAKRLMQSPQKSDQKIKVIDPNIKSLQNDLSEKLGTKVFFQHASSGKGKLVIHYNSLEELDGILERIQ